METEADERAAPDFGRLLELATQILAPITALTAVLYYFGYVRYQEFFAYFGVDLASAGISRTGYFLGSARIALRPLILALLIALAALAAHYALALWLPHAAPRAKRLLPAGTGGCALLFGVAAVLGLLGVTDFGSSTLPPLALAGAALLCGYTAYLARDAALPASLTEVMDRTRTVRIIVLSGTVLVATFWGVANYAQERGIVAARAFEQSLPLQARVVVYSSQPLLISGRGVVVDKLSGPSPKYAYRYSGLRVLAHSTDRWLIVPAGWSRTDSTVIVLPDMDDEIRVDLAP